MWSGWLMSRVDPRTNVLRQHENGEGKVGHRSGGWFLYASSCEWFRCGIADPLSLPLGGPADDLLPSARHSPLQHRTHPLHFFAHMFILILKPSTSQEF